MKIINCRSNSRRTASALIAFFCAVSCCESLPAASKSKIGAFGSHVWQLDQNGNNVWDGTTTDGLKYWSLGEAGETPVYGDWNGDGRTKVGVYFEGTWMLDYNGNGVWDGPNVDKLVYLGGQGYEPVVGDWNGSGWTKIGAHNNGTWLIDLNGNFAWDGPGTDKLLFFGNVGYKPVVGDWNGSGTTKIGAYKDANWILDFNGNFAWDGTGVDKLFPFGPVGYEPVVGIWDVPGGTTKIGVYYAGTWMIDLNGTFLLDGPDKIVYFGYPGYTPMVGDWNGNGTTKIATYHDGAWLIDLTGDFDWGAGDVSTYFGGPGYKPVVGAWPDPVAELADFTQCIGGNGSTCSLHAGTYVVNSTLNAARYGVTLSGASTDRSLTKLVRGPGLSGPLVQVSVTDTAGTTRTMAQAGASTGVVIKNLTFCGGGNTHANLHVGGNPAAMSPAGSPCGDQHTPAPSLCDYSNPCVDLSVDSIAVDLNSNPGGYPTNPSAYTGPFALELNNVDLEDSAGHALGLYAAANNNPVLGKRVNDVWIHNSAINYSAVTGILWGVNFVRYDDKFCDGYADNNPQKTFADDPALC